MGKNRAAVVTVEKRPERVNLMAFSGGEVDMATCPDIQFHFKSCNEPGDRWVFDLRVPYLESEPIIAILTIVAIVRDDGGEAAIICNEAFCAFRVLVRILRIDQHIKILPDLETSLAYLENC